MRKLLVAIFAIAPAIGAQAAVINNRVVQQSNITMSATDLINQTGGQLSGSPTVTGFNAYTDPSTGTSSPSLLNDGTSNGYDINASHSAVTTQTTPWSISYRLNTTTNTAGYDITGINVLSIWSVDFLNQNFTVRYATPATPTVFDHTIGIFTQDQTTYGDGAALESLVSDNAGAKLATGVAAIQFTFNVEPSAYSTTANHAAYRELDVLGTASPTPEPASAGLLASGGLLLVRRRRRA